MKTNRPGHRGRGGLTSAPDCAILGVEAALVVAGDGTKTRNVRFGSSTKALLTDPQYVGVANPETGQKPAYMGVAQKAVRRPSIPVRGRKHLCLAVP